MRGPAHTAPGRHVDMLHLAHLGPSFSPVVPCGESCDLPVGDSSLVEKAQEICTRPGTGEGVTVTAPVMATATPARYCVRWSPASFAAESDAPGPEQNTYPSSPSMKPPAGNQKFSLFFCLYKQILGRKGSCTCSNLSGAVFN